MSRDGFTKIILYILSEAWMRKELSSEADLLLDIRLCAYSTVFKRREEYKGRI
jgi:hypothetical protein